MIEFEASGSTEALVASMQRVAGASGVAGLLVFAADEDQHCPERLGAALRALAVPVVGGIFPQVLHGGTHHLHGSVVVGLPVFARPGVLEALSDPELDMDAAVEALIDPSLRDTTVLVLVDGFARRISDMLRAMFEIHGIEQNYIGGGAGSLSMQQKPCLLSNVGVLMDAALVVQIPLPSGVGVSHGWSPISEPMKVTRSAHAAVQELNYQPALEVYRGIVEAHAGHAITREGFFDIAKGYPFGILKLGTEMAVRDPILVDDSGALVCVGEVPEGSFVQILTGDPDSLVEAAGHANRRAHEGLAGHGPAAAKLLIDCISRVLFLEDGFDRELAQLEDGTPSFGALTLGEIANSGRDFLEFHNKTAVVGMFPAGAGEGDGAAR